MFLFLFHPKGMEFLKQNWVLIAVGIVILYAVNQKLKKAVDGSYEDIDNRVRTM